MSQNRLQYLVDIDMLFDMRLEIAERLNPEYGVVQLHEGKWFTRESDKELREMCGLSQDAYRHFYREHYAELIRSSLATNFLYSFLSHINRGRDDNRPHISQHRVLHINLAEKYSGFDDEDSKMLVNAISLHFPGYFDEIVIVSKPHEETNPIWLVQMGYTDYYCYHWQDWLSANQKAFEDHLTPGLTMWFPRLKHMSDFELDEKVMQSMKERGEYDPFDLVSLLFNPALNIYWLKPIDICVCLPHDR